MFEIINSDFTGYYNVKKGDYYLAYHTKKNKHVMDKNRATMFSTVEEAQKAIDEYLKGLNNE